MADHKTFRCKLVTPNATLLDEPARYASIPAWDGLFGVLPGRAPILAKLGAGALHIEFPESTHAKGGDRSFAVSDGFVKMSDNELTIIAEQAVPAEKINATDAKAELDEAEARKIPDDAGNPLEEREKLDKAKQFARVKLRLAEQSRSKGI